MNIKFPKDEVQIINDIEKMFNVNNYSGIVKQYNKIIDNIDMVLNIKPNTINIIIESLFYCRQFDTIITFVESLRNKGFEDFLWYFYAFASIIGNDDIYLAKTILKKSKLLNDPDIQFYYSEDGANYVNILGMNDCILEKQGPCLIMINFINDLIYESLQKAIDAEYVIMRAFDLINILCEDGASQELIELFINTLQIIFEIDS